VAAHDPVALAEIDLYGELMIAAAATPFERLPADRIDEVLRVVPGAERRIDRYRELGEAQVPSQGRSPGQGKPPGQGRTVPTIPAQARPSAQAKPPQSADQRG